MSNGDKCVLCLEEKRSPIRITCGHSFCHQCLSTYKSYQKYAWAKRCPICRGALKEKKYSVKKKETRISTTAATTAPSEQICILEEFMAIAAGTDVSSHITDDQAETVDYETETVDVDNAADAEHDTNANVDDDEVFYSDEYDDEYDSDDDDVVDEMYDDDEETVLIGDDENVDDDFEETIYADSDNDVYMLDEVIIID